MKKEIFITSLLLGSILVSSMRPPALALSFEDWDRAPSESDWSLEDAGRVYMHPEFLGSNLLRIEVRVADLNSPILGGAFHLRFSPEHLDFLRYEPGDFLERGGDPFYLVREEEGRVIFGETLRRDDEFPLGDGVLVNMFFQILEEKVTELKFERAVLSTLDSVRQDLLEIEWEDLTLDRNKRYDLGEVGADSVLNVIGEETDWWQKINWRILGAAILSVVFVLFVGRKIQAKNPAKDLSTINRG